MTTRFMYTPFADVASVQLDAPGPVFVAMLDEAIIGYFRRNDPTELVTVIVEDFSSVWPVLNPQFLDKVLGPDVTGGLQELSLRSLRLPDLPDVSHLRVAQFEEKFEEIVREHGLAFDWEVAPASDAVRGARLLHLIDQGWVDGDIPERLRPVAPLPASRTAPLVRLAYDPDTDVAVIDYGDSRADEPVELDDQLTAIFRVDDPAALAYLEVTDASALLTDQRERLAGLLGEKEINQLARLVAEAGSGEEAGVAQAQLVGGIVTPQVVEARLGAHRKAGRPQFALIISRAAGKVAETVEQVVSGLRISDLSPEAQPVLVAPPGEGEVREQFVWEYGGGNPVSLTVIRRGNRFRVEGLAADHKGGQLGITAWVKPGAARSLEFSGNYDTDEKRVSLSIPIDPDDGWFGATLATLRTRAPVQGGELFDDIEIVVGPPS